MKQFVRLFMLPLAFAVGITQAQAEDTIIIAMGDKAEKEVAAPAEEKTMVDSAADTAGSALGAVTGAVGDAASAVAETTGDVVDAAADTAGDAVDATTDAAGSVADAVTETAGDAAKMAKDAVAHPYTSVDAKELKALIAEKKDLVIIDSRGGKYLKSGDDIIEGAINIPADKTTADSLAKAVKSKETPIVFYCSNEQCPASAAAANVANAAGYTNLYKLPEGIEGWKKAGGATAKLN